MLPLSYMDNVRHEAGPTFSETYKLINPHYKKERGRGAIRFQVRRKERPSTDLRPRAPPAPHRI